MLMRVRHPSAAANQIAVGPDVLTDDPRMRFFAAIIQDIYDNNVKDIKKGNAIADYDIRCTAQNNCQRIAW